MSRWREVTIKDACEVMNGGTPKTKVAEYWNGPHAWITPAEMGNLPTPYLEETRRTLTDDGLEHSSAKLIPPFSVILSSRAPIGHLVINSVPMAFNQGCKGLVPGESLDHKYLYYYLSANVDLLNELGTGTTFKELSATKLKSVPLPLPPLAEQKRIVAKLDAAFAAIDTATAHARQNLTNARELFESHLNAVFTDGGPGWSESTLIDLCEVFVDSAHRTPKYQEEGIPALRPRDVVNGELNLEDARRVSEEQYEIQSKRHKPRPGDIVYSRELSYGWAAVLPEAPKVCLSQGMCLFRPGQAIETDLFLYILNGPIGRDQAQDAAVGAAHPHINLSEIKSYRIPVPPRKQQRVICERLDDLKSETDQLAAIYTRKLALLAELKQSLLAKAFTGELTSEPAELVEAEISVAAPQQQIA